MWGKKCTFKWHTAVKKAAAAAVLASVHCWAITFYGRYTIFYRVVVTRSMRQGSGQLDTPGARAKSQKYHNCSSIHCSRTNELSPTERDGNATRLTLCFQLPKGSSWIGNWKTTPNAWTELKLIWMRRYARSQMWNKNDPNFNHDDVYCLITPPTILAGPRNDDILSFKDLLT